MVDNDYMPQQGDIIAVDFNPQIGHEQRGIRPALVISNIAFNHYTKLLIVCPITSNTKYFPFHVMLDEKTKTKGAIMCEQLKSIDYKTRNIKFCEKISDNLYDEVYEIIKSFYQKL